LRPLPGRRARASLHLSFAACATQGDLAYRIDNLEISDMQRAENAW
jgi:hypothetical protein